MISESLKTNVSFEAKDSIAFITITRPEVRNAVNRETAEVLADTFDASTATSRSELQF